MKCFYPKTKEIRDCDALEFFSHSMLFPKAKLIDFSKQSATDIIAILLQPLSPTIPTLQAGDLVRNAILILAMLLSRVEDMPKLAIKNKNIKVLLLRIQN